MVDITHKSNTLRIATAEATVTVSHPDTITALVNKTVPKGDVFEMAKTAGLFGVKKTAELIPDCHPLPVEYTGISYDINGLEVKITIEVKTIYKTGVEVEAMHGASIIALTMYDMLKPIDKGIEINNIRLVSKKGGKSDFKPKAKREFNAGVLVCSDTISKGLKEDKAGLAIQEKLDNCGVTPAEYAIIPDEVATIQETIKAWCPKVNLIVVTGGTGLSPRDVTPEAIQPLLERNIPGIMEAARAYGQNRTPYAMLSRGVAGVIGNTVVLAVPGSTKGASETMDALLPQLLHVFRTIKGDRHD